MKQISHKNLFFANLMSCGNQIWMEYVALEWSLSKFLHYYSELDQILTFCNILLYFLHPHTMHREQTETEIVSLEIVKV